MIAGPAVIEEAEATTILWPGDRLSVDAQRNLVIQIGVLDRRPIDQAAGVAT